MSSRTAMELRQLLQILDGRGYKAYRDVKGAWDFEAFRLLVDHIQGDPFAAPSRVRLLLEPHAAGLPPDAFRSPHRRRGTESCLADAFASAARRSSRHLGTGKGGEIRMDGPGQQVLARTALMVDVDGGVEARFTVGLPARGRRVMGMEAARLLTETLPELAQGTLLAGAHDPDALERWAVTNEDAEALRATLEDRDLVAFVADGARLPRRSGVDDRPLEGAEVVSFASPESLRVTLDAPNAGPVTGMGVPRGVTLIVGGGFHGKSTLLRALESGVYNHRPGDGREQVVTVKDAVKIRAEDGRSVAGVDISGFIDDLPLGQTTRSFSTPNASGSTSQAAAIVEALEAGARTLLMDEDTSATNFMIRDRRMQALVPKDGEPITPFVDRARELFEAHGVSTVLVLGGSGDYLDVADTVVAMREYAAAEVTDRARTVADTHPTGRLSEPGAPFTLPGPRRVQAPSLNPEKGRRDVHVRALGRDALLYGTAEIDLSAVEQVVDAAQVRAMGHAMALLHDQVPEAGATLPDLLDAVEKTLAAHGLDALDSRHPGDLAAFRRFELAAAMNRLRSLRVQ